MLSMLAKLLDALNSDSAPGQIALAFSLSLITGLTPLMSLHNLLILLLACLLRVHFGAFLLGTGFFSALAYLTDPASVQIGYALLTDEGLREFWTTLYQSDVWRAFRFNQTLVLGSFVLAAVLFLPVFFLSKWLIVRYREQLKGWVENLKITRWIKASRFYRLYQTVAG